MLSSRGTLVNKELIDKDAKNKSTPYSQIILSNSKELFKINSFEVNDMSKFHFEIEKLKEILLSNGYFNKSSDKCIS